MNAVLLEKRVGIFEVISDIRGLQEEGKLVSICMRMYEFMFTHDQRSQGGNKMTKLNVISRQKTITLIIYVFISFITSHNIYSTCLKLKYIAVITVI